MSCPCNILMDSELESVVQLHEQSVMKSSLAHAWRSVGGRGKQCSLSALDDPAAFDVCALWQLVMFCTCPFIKHAQLHGRGRACDDV